MHLKQERLSKKQKKEEERLVSEQAPPQLKRRKNQIEFLYQMNKKRKSR